MAFAVVAPCLGPWDQVYLFWCIPHQIPIYLPGLIQDTSLITEGSFRFSMSVEVISSPCFSAIIIVLQGLYIGDRARTFSPVDQGVRSHFSMEVSLQNRFINASSIT